MTASAPYWHVLAVQEQSSPYYPVMPSGAVPSGTLAAIVTWGRRGKAPSPSQTKISFNPAADVSGDGEMFCDVWGRTALSCRITRPATSPTMDAPSISRYRQFPVGVSFHRAAVSASRFRARWRRIASRAFAHPPPAASNRHRDKRGATEAGKSRILNSL